MEARKRLVIIRIILIGFIIALVLSGLTAVFLHVETPLLVKMFGPGTWVERVFPAMSKWLVLIDEGVQHTYTNYPFILYGLDWLAFGHIIIAVFLTGAVKDPSENIWVIKAGMIACVLVIPAAFVCGPFRGIPFYWQLIDCSFGVIGIVPLYYVYRSSS